RRGVEAVRSARLRSIPAKRDLHPHLAAGEGDLVVEGGRGAPGEAEPPTGHLLVLVEIPELELVVTRVRLAEPIAEGDLGLEALEQGKERDRHGDEEQEPSQESTPGRALRRDVR